MSPLQTGLLATLAVAVVLVAVDLAGYRRWRADVLAGRKPHPNAAWARTALAGRPYAPSSRALLVFAGEIPPEPADRAFLLPGLWTAWVGGSR